jgi:hypothetical protein
MTHREVRFLAVASRDGISKRTASRIGPRPFRALSQTLAGRASGRLVRILEQLPSLFGVVWLLVQRLRIPLTPLPL